MASNAGTTPTSPAMDTPAYILVLDDEAGVRDLIHSYRSQHGYRVSKAGDEQALRRLLVEEPVDLVILDLGLPGEDGLSLVEN